MWGYSQVSYPIANLISRYVSEILTPTTPTYATDAAAFCTKLTKCSTSDL